MKAIGLHRRRLKFFVEFYKIITDLVRKIKFYFTD